MQEEIKKIIEKNLPAEVGNLLQERLKMADFLEKKIVELEKDLESRSKRVLMLEEDMEVHRALDSKREELGKLEKDLDKASRNLRVSLLEFKLECEEKNTEFARNLAMGLVRNIEFRKSVFDNEIQDGYTGQDGNWVPTRGVTKNYNEENKAD